ncbi:MAG: NAD(P)-dependent oxidoreductase [Lacunisphaera sp.]|nr:NAD(P)-dependent oxidoreductase [Lacunisphaera sp.]
MTRRKVLITGASGLIGGLTIKHLGDKYEFSGLSRRPVAGIPHLSADITDAAAIKPAFAGIHTVLHLAAANGADQWLAWAPTMAITIQGTLNVYEAAREAGVQRVVFISSGSCQIAWEWDSNHPYGKLANGPDDEIPAAWPMVDLNWPVRPDSPYSVGKLFGENLGRYYFDKYGISTIAIRLGAVNKENRPLVRRLYPGYLSQSDCVQLIDKCLGAPESLKYEIVNAISENKYRWRSTDRTKEIFGWRPTGNSDAFPLERPNELSSDSRLISNRPSPRR